MPETSRPHVRILYVEDDPLVREMTSDILAGLGHAVRTAPDAETALPLIGETDLLITDLGLPGMDGRGLARAARAAAPGLRVIIVSGRREAEEESIDATWVGKPYSLQTLTDAVAGALQGARPAS